jgi:imidazole glycerol-phosphate synthase subunit HisH
MIAIVDYGMGNLRSVQKGFERVGAAAKIVSRPEDLAAAERLVLPDAMAALRAQHLVEPIKQHLERGRPFLGICLGFQMLFDASHEDGVHPGLGVFPGVVAPFQVPKPLKVPHMGWNAVAWRRRPPCAEGLPPDAHFYFVHSYFVRPADPTIVAGETDYGGPFCAAVWREHIVATQFHPEKSQAAGLRLLHGFAHG